MYNVISILCPCYNEEEALPHFFRKIFQVTDSLPETFEIICVNDGSRDNTLSVLESYAAEDSRVKVIDLSRNFGKEAALTAALDYASGDAVIPIDADLQDPPELIADMIAKWHEGYEVVLARAQTGLQIHGRRDSPQRCSTKFTTQSQRRTSRKMSATSG